VGESIVELARSVARLPYKERVAIVCRYWADLPEQEIAEILGVRPATVRSLVSRALGRLRLEVER
jgi:RNA polymerase sigma factor (sigma-70 family)